jgi:hypothetical protein
MAVQAATIHGRGNTKEERERKKKLAKEWNDRRIQTGRVLHRGHDYFLSSSMPAWVMSSAMLFSKSSIREPISSTEESEKERGRAQSKNKKRETKQKYAK